MLDFTAEDHRYTWDGQVVPSVTQVLGVINDYASVPDYLLARAADRGTAVHRICELHDYGTLGEYDLSYVAYLEAWKQFLHDKQFDIELNESRTYNKKHRYAGQLDRVGRIIKRKKMVRAICDIKTTAQLMPIAGPQTAAYQESFNASNPEDPVTLRFVVQLKPDGTYRYHEHPDRMDFSIFTSCLNIHRWNERIK